MTKGGTRLKTRFLLGDDGTREFRGWHDSQFGMPCKWKSVDLVTWSCVPDSFASLSGPYFKDAECTVPVATALPAGEYRIRYDGVATYDVYEQGPAASPVFKINEDTAVCEPNAPPDVMYEWTKTALTFVTATESQE